MGSVLDRLRPVRTLTPTLTLTLALTLGLARARARARALTLTLTPKPTPTPTPSLTLTLTRYRHVRTMHYAQEEGGAAEHSGRRRPFASTNIAILSMLPGYHRLRRAAPQSTLAGSTLALALALALTLTLTLALT